MEVIGASLRAQAMVMRDVREQIEQTSAPLTLARPLPPT
jgi:hypothetical protein